MLLNNPRLTYAYTVAFFTPNRAATSLVGIIHATSPFHHNTRHQNPA